MIFNLDALRKIFPITNSSTDLISLCSKYFQKYPESNCADQDFLNYIFSKDYLQLPPRFTIPVRENRFDSSIDLQAILQFSSHALGINTRDPFNRLWFKYFVKTPFFSLDLFANLFDELPMTFGKFLSDYQRGNPIDLDQISYNLLRRF